MEEKLFRVIVYQAGRPTSVYFKGTYHECEVMQEAWHLLHRNMPYYANCDAGIEAVRYDAYGDEICFAEERDEYDHCAAMGDFDY